MEIYTSDSSDTDSRERKTLNYGNAGMETALLEQTLRTPAKTAKQYEILLLNHNRLSLLPSLVKQFTNLRVLDLSSNALIALPDELWELPLITLVAKNNRLTDDALPKSFRSSAGLCALKELNLSGNLLTRFPQQLTELQQLKYLYLGGNQIACIAKDVWKMHGLHMLSMGGNLLNEIPESVGQLSQLQALVLCDNAIERLPMSIVRLKNLKSLLLHKNRLKHLPRDIIALERLTELSLRDNPLVDRFVQDMALKPPSLLELAGRIVKRCRLVVHASIVPRTLLDYLDSANCCVNPNCNGVFFDNRVEHIKFVDFCGKYRIPLLEYLCSAKCIEDAEAHSQRQQHAAQRHSSGALMRKVLLG